MPKPPILVTEEITPPPALIRAGLDALPAMIRAKPRRFIQLFTASIRNRNTRMFRDCLGHESGGLHLRAKCSVICARVCSQDSAGLPASAARARRSTSAIQVSSERASLGPDGCRLSSNSATTSARSSSGSSSACFKIFFVDWGISKV